MEVRAERAPCGECPSVMCGEEFRGGKSKEWAMERGRGYGTIGSLEGEITRSQKRDGQDLSPELQF